MINSQILKYGFVLAISASLAACSTTEPKPEATSPIIVAKDKSDISEAAVSNANDENLLLKDGQNILLTWTSGPAKNASSSLGPGMFVRAYSKETTVFGTSTITEHTSEQLKLRGPRGNICTLLIGGKLSCPKVGNGTWEVTELAPN